MHKNIEDRIFTYSDFNKAYFKEKVYKVGLSVGLECPHRKNNGGCIFCNPYTFTHSYLDDQNSIKNQLVEGIRNVKKYAGNSALLAYFQDETSTAGDFKKLINIYKTAIKHKKIRALTISTRPDYISDKMISTLDNFDIPVTIEFGMQSIHEKSLKYLNRGHSLNEIEEAVKKCAKAGIEVAVHLIIGIPGETEKDILETIAYISENKNIKQVKFHNLVAYKNTILGEKFLNNEFPKMNLEKYLDIMEKVISNLRGDIVILRLFTSNSRKSNIALNSFEGIKPEWRNKLRLRLIEKNIYQGQNTAVKFSTEKIPEFIKNHF